MQKRLSATPLIIQNGFYYIGKNPANIEKLVNLFKRGYASDSIDNARAELKRSIDQEKNTLPEVIFCESSFEFSRCKKFCSIPQQQSFFCRYSLYHGFHAIFVKWK